jgi:ketosteroid isomerase-like protein
MSVHDQRRIPTSAAVTAAGLDHVRLSYQYLDSGDIDGFGSLLDEDVQVTRPDAPQGFGRAEVLRLHSQIAEPAVRHHIYKMVANGDCVAVMGRFIRVGDERGAVGARLGGPDVEFADFFTLSDEGMLLSCRRFYFAPPR